MPFMSEFLKPFIANGTEITLKPGDLAPDVLLRDYFHNNYDDEKGWWFGSGNPEFLRFGERLIIPGGRALDLGAGYGRASVFFALHGMDVTSVENSPSVVRSLKAFSQAYDVPINIFEQDISDTDFGRSYFDTVIISQAFQHGVSQEQAFAIIDRAADAIKPGGHLWLRAAGTADSGYNEALWQASVNGYHAEDVDGYFDPITLLHHLTASSHLALVDTQLIPRVGVANIQFGEDWKKPTKRPEDAPPITDHDKTVAEYFANIRANTTHGFVTVLAQKPLAT
jgi:SAM-dependent methyltransferase